MIIPSSLPLRRRLAAASVAALIAALPACAGGAGAGRTGTVSSAAARAASSVSAAPTATAQPFKHVPTQAVCRRVLGSACYAADAVRRAYGVDKLDAAGITGKGRTVVVWEEVVPDTLRADLETFSTSMKLPLPDLTVDRYAPAGHIAPFDAQNARMAGAALETTLDTQMVHMLAPDAKIVVTQIGLPEHAYASPSPGTPTTPSAQDTRRAAAVGAALILDGIAQSVRNHRPDAISISYGIEEYTAAGDSQAPADGLLAFSPALAEVVASGTTLTASTGDFGAAPPVGPGRERVRSVSWPASDPSVLALGGSRLHLDAEGRRTGPDTVWHDRAGATGGGPSQTFARPRYQDRVADVVGERRGTPDISMDGSASGGTLVYQGFLPAGAGWLPVGGTSEAAPMFAALVALANQEAGRRLGALHEALYALAGDPHGGVVDITEGDNGPYGFQATPGYDLASGLGTVDASVLVPQLAARVRPRR
ncbi:S53 family peptidase [Streptomyces albulus]|uniref:S53 family peptidase n=1 Tax=Streptomyces noursei TaxID=1971 RepID=UPI001F2EF609|nr:S53 family peptidase [Streptomyces noursei]MCE4943612.1 S53 family peptidase [Streptomyces noursei]